LGVPLRQATGQAFRCKSSFKGWFFVGLCSASLVAGTTRKNSTFVLRAFHFNPSRGFVHQGAINQICSYTKKKKAFQLNEVSKIRSL
jgi:hypothetical protein